MSRPSLPEKDSSEASALIELYLTCTSSVIDQLTREYGYKTRNNFVDAMREKFGARRKHIPDTPQDNTIENEVLVNKGKIHHLTTGNNIRDIVIINDTHIPYQDRVSVMLTMRAIEDIQPAYIILNGDIIDFYSISRFSVDPKRWLSIQDDLDDTREFLRQLKELSDAKIIFCAGNHENRLKHYLWNKASELLMLRDLDIRQQLGLNIFDIDYADYDTIVRINNMFDVEHGDTVSKHSGWTAKAMWEKRGGNGICGHSHRIGSYLKTFEKDTYGWWENGCLCSLDVEYIKSPNWQQGFSVVTFNKSRFFTQQVPIIKHKFVFRGKLYE